jgi:ABC-type bacteriocin/lantibiotic exporter with double-glycine peptidase domain
MSTVRPEQERDKGLCVHRLPGAAPAENRSGGTWRVPLRRTVVESRKAIISVWRVATYCHAYRRRILLLVLLTPILTLPPLLTPMVTQFLIDKAYPKRDFYLLAGACLGLLALQLLPRMLALVTGYLSMYVQTMLQYRLTLRVFQAIQRLPQSYFEEHDSGLLLERVRYDVGAVAGSMTQLLPRLVEIVFTFASAIPLMMRLHTKIALLALAVVPVHYAVTAGLSRRLVALGDAGRAMDEKVTTFTAETIQGAMTARLFSLCRRRRKRFKQLLREYVRIGVATWRTTAFWGELGGWVTTIWGLLLLVGGWCLVFSDRLQLGQAVALGMYINLLGRPFQQIESLYQSLMGYSVAARRVLEILEMRPQQRQSPIRSALARPPRRFELHRLSFSYRGGRPCLQDVDLCLHGGQTVAVVGPSGAGKSTLIRILAGLDDRYVGQFLVDGRDFRTIDPDSYLHQVSMVPQTSFFFSDSIRDNLSSGDGPLSLENLDRCSRLLGLSDVIDAAPDRFDTRLGAEGIRLSVGQYQKLAALRAMVKHASLLLLDEVTSSMDIESERRLLQGIVALRSRDCATLFVTHHIGITTEPWIDEILVLVNGRVAERGSCTTLRAQGGFYHHWLGLNQGPLQDRAILVDTGSGENN